MAALPWKRAENSLAFEKPQDLCLRFRLTKQEPADPAFLSWSNAAPEVDTRFTPQANQVICRPKSAGQLKKAQGTNDTLTVGIFDVLAIR